MRFLGVLDSFFVAAGRRWQVLASVEVLYCPTGSLEGLVGQGRRVRAHVGYVACLVEVLGDAHSTGCGKAQFSAGFLLQRRCHERWVGRALPRLFLDGADLEVGAGEPVREGTGASFVEDEDVSTRELAVFAEIPPCSQAFAVQSDQLCPEGATVGLGRRAEAAREVPVGRCAERYPRPFALDQEPRRH